MTLRRRAWLQAGVAPAGFTLHRNGNAIRTEQVAVALLDCDWKLNNAR